MTYPAPDKPPKDDWFDNPLDSMPIATDKGGFDWEDTAPSEYEPPDEEPEEVTMHEKMYRMATARYNPFSIGGSENCHSDIDYIKKHSPWPGGSENFQGGSENASRN